MSEKSADTDAMKECIASLLERIDDMVAAPPCQFEINGMVVPDEGGHSLHSFGMTPDWYVEAAHLSCYGVKPNTPLEEQSDD